MSNELNLLAGNLPLKVHRSEGLQATDIGDPELKRLWQSVVTENKRKLSDLAVDYPFSNQIISKSEDVYLHLFNELPDLDLSIYFFKQGQSVPFVGPSEVACFIPQANAIAVFIEDMNTNELSPEAEIELIAILVHEYVHADGNMEALAGKDTPDSKKIIFDLAKHGFRSSEDEVSIGSILEEVVPTIAQFKTIQYLLDNQGQPIDKDPFDYMQFPIQIALVRMFQAIESKLKDDLDSKGMSLFELFVGARNNAIKEQELRLLINTIETDLYDKLLQLQYIEKSFDNASSVVDNIDALTKSISTVTD